MVDEVFAIYKPKLRFEGVLSTTTCPLSVRSSETHRNVVKDLFATSTRISRHSSRLVLLELQQASVRPFFLSLSISLSISLSLSHLFGINPRVNIDSGETSVVIKLYI